MTADTTRPTRRLFRHNSPCPEPDCGGRLQKSYGDFMFDGFELTCRKCSEDPRWAKNVLTRRERENGK